MPIHDYVIVGAGFAGAATAWALAERGVEDVVLLEQEATPGVHSSGRNAGYVRARADHPAWQTLCRDGARLLGEASLAPYDRTGALLLGLGTEDVSRRVPLARGEALWCPDDGIVDVAALLACYLRGRDVRYRCRLLRVHAGKTEPLRLETSDGDLGARVLVNAAGPWGGLLGSLRITPFNRHVYVTAPMPEVDPSWPFVLDQANGLYFRPESGGLLLSPCDETPAAPGDYAEDASMLELLAERVMAQQPGLGDLAIAHRWVGQRTFAADRAPVIGFDPREPRLFHVTGLGGHGVTASAAIGRLAASLL